MRQASLSISFYKFYHSIKSKQSDSITTNFQLCVIAKLTPSTMAEASLKVGSVYCTTSACKAKMFPTSSRAIVTATE
ncbi:hypothetical protein TorRG33x02_326170 [Trema orientale]|uniref:Uncharacterized protein n=1 Tax=Trema orientale TaxID=63057 RepID=A0A2P5BC58_TREOI|nr:hypothetical protein TorRG33x02_326170 [Trema orientale]